MDPKVINANSKLVKDTISGVMLLCDSFDFSTKMSHSSKDLLVTGLGDWVEDIDDLNKSITMSGPILIGSSEDQIGYRKTLPTKDHTGLLSSKIFNDLYTWVSDSRIPIFSIENISIDISNNATINISLAPHSPYVVQESGALVNLFSIPSFTVYSTNEIFRDLQTAENFIAARTLKYYDLNLDNGQEVPIEIRNVYVSNLKIDFSMDWNPIKTIPTATTITDHNTLEQVNYSTVASSDIYNYVIRQEPTNESETTTSASSGYTPYYGPIIPMNVLQNVHSSCTIEMYNFGYLPGNSLEKWIAGYWNDGPPLHVKLRDNNLIKLTRFLDPAQNSDVLGISDVVSSNCYWRVEDIDVKASGGELVKYTITLKGIYKSVPNILRNVPVALA